jgi:hypothetical protein
MGVGTSRLLVLPAEEADDDNPTEVPLEVSIWGFLKARLSNAFSAVRKSAFSAVRKSGSLEVWISAVRTSGSLEVWISAFSVGRKSGFSAVLVSAYLNSPRF